MIRKTNSIGNNIIFDTDIIVTDINNNLSTLDNVIKDQNKKISRIESNTKWLYKYGGMGSGGGTSEETSFKADVIDNKTGKRFSIGNNNRAEYDTPGKYTYTVKVYKGGKSTYNVKWYWKTGDITTEPTPETLTPEKAFQATISPLFSANSTLFIEFLNNDQPDEKPIVYEITVIVNPYAFNIKYINAKTKKDIIVQNNNIYMKDYVDDGLIVGFESEVNTTLLSASYTYTDWNGKQHIVDCPNCNSPLSFPNEIQSNSKKTIYLNLVEPDEKSSDPYSEIKKYLSNKKNSGLKSFYLNTSIQLASKDTQEDTIYLKLKDTLIPEGLYLKIMSDDEISLNENKIQTFAYYQYVNNNWIEITDRNIIESFDQNDVINAVCHTENAYGVSVGNNNTIICENNNLFQAQYVQNSNDWVKIDELPEGKTAIDAVEHGNNYYCINAIEGQIIKQDIANYSNGVIVGNSINIHLTPYFDSIQRPPREFNFSLYLDGWKVHSSKIGNTTTLTEQAIKTITLLIPNDNRYSHELKFKIQDSATSTTYEQILYLGTIALETFDWYTIKPNGNSYYRKGNSSSGIQNKRTKQILDQTSDIIVNINSNEDTYLFTVDPIDDDGRKIDISQCDQVINIGFQYSVVNNTNNEIFTLGESINNKFNAHLKIYQDKIIVGTDDQNKIDITIEKEEDLNIGKLNQYHLLTIQTKLEKQYQSTGNLLKSILIYIDGVLEGAYQDFITQNTFNSIILHKGNYIVNLLDCAYFKNNNAQYTDNSCKILNFSDITQYYYAYDEKLLGNGFKEKDILYMKKHILHSNFAKLSADQDNFVMVDSFNIINDIARYSNSNVLLITLTDLSANKISESDCKAKYTDNFRTWVSKNRDDGKPGATIPVTLQWSEPNENDEGAGLKRVLFDQTTEDFSLQQQGSSTLSYFAKNFELGLPESTGDTQKLFTPNFKKANILDPEDLSYKDSFLPERSFTLKADVVDSSHSNNNTMGKFINDIILPYDRSSSSSTDLYNNYIKNSLIGFPILVFFESIYTAYNPETREEKQATNYYFLGIYNFNLGRKSYYNLGYKDPIIFETTKISSDYKSLLKYNDGFNIVEVFKNLDLFYNGVQVGEIQEGVSYFDFSQSDQTVLFQLPNLDSDKGAMFGDLVSKPEQSGAMKNNIANFVKDISYSGAYIFEQIKKELSEDPNDNYGYLSSYMNIDPITYTSLNRVPNFKHIITREANEKGDIVVLTSDSATLSVPETMSKLKEVLEGVKEDKKIKKLKTLDYKSLTQYYTTCMAFGLIDSVEKNLNIKSWNEGQTFNIAFYDMDTCLGINNSGGKINYYAFSDYWPPNFKDGQLKSTEVEFDFSPRLLPGIIASEQYDIPSSYLFSIAKYAATIYKYHGDQEFKEVFNASPYNIYALWRASNSDGADPTTITRGKGCLRNAKYFVEKYYKNHLKVIPIDAFNYNYCYKYLLKQSNSEGIYVQYVAKYLLMFWGRKLGYTKEWLNSRLHILDAYFNLQKITGFVNGSNYSLPAPDDDNIDSKNDDIYVIHDIFTTDTTGNDYVKPINSTIKALPYSPISIKNSSDGNATRYITPATDDFININIDVPSKNKVLIGGSAQFTYLNSIDPYITQLRTLNITSKYLETIKSVTQYDVETTNAGNPCQFWNITTPSILSVELISRNYGGTLAFNSKNKNLQYINISNSSIKLNASDIPLVKLIAKNVKDSSLNITGINTLSSVDIDGSFSKINIPAWTSKIQFPINTNNDFSVEALTVNNTDNIFENACLSIIGITELTSVNASYFSEIYINGCPNLQSLTIGDNVDLKPPELKHLSVLFNSNASDFNFKINSDNEYDVNLSTFDNLTELYLNSATCRNICLSPKATVNLRTKALFNCNKLQKIQPTKISNAQYTKIKLLGNSVFYGCSKFSLSSIHNFDDNLTTHDSFVIDSSVKSLRQMFDVWNIGDQKGSITTDDAKYFLSICSRPEINANITNINNLFMGQTHIEYDASTMISEYNKKQCSLSIDLPNVSQAGFAFYGTNVKAFNKYMFSTLASSASSLNIKSIFNGDQFATTDFLQFIIDKITSFVLYNDGGGSQKYSSHKITFIEPEDTGNNYKNVDIVDLSSIFIFKNNNKTILPSQLTVLENLNIQNVIRIDNLFNPLSNWPYFENNGLTFERIGIANTLSINVNISVDDDYNDIIINPLDSLFSGVQLNNVADCFENICFVSSIYVIDQEEPKEIGHYEFGDITDSVYTDIGSFIDWSRISNLKSICGYNTYTGHQLNFNKKISYNVDKKITTPYGIEISSYSFQSVWDKIAQNNSLTAIRYLFESCYVEYEDTDPESISNFYLNSYQYRSNNSSINTKLSCIDYIFNNMKVVDYYNYGTNPLYLSFTCEFFKFFKNLTSLNSSFKNLKLKHTLPYNFFNKRYALQPEKVWIDDPDIRNAKLSGILQKFSYRKDITSLENCFENADFEYIDGFDYNAKYNYLESDQEKHCITDTYISCNETLSNLHVPYYNRRTDTSAIPYLSSTEITDCNISTLIKYELDPTKEFRNKNISAFLNDNFLLNYDLQSCIKDHNLTTLYDKLFIAPDILYGVIGNTVKITYMFANSNDKEITLGGANTSRCDKVYTQLSAQTATDIHSNTFTGALPKHMLLSCQTTIIANTFKNLNIIPTFIGSLSSEEYDTSEYTVKTVYTDQYVFVPEDFIKSSNLNNAFNFRIFLPPRTNNRFSTEENNYVKYYLLLTTSITTSVINIQNAFPTNVYYGIIHDPTDTDKESSRHDYIYSEINSGLQYVLIGYPTYIDNILQNIQDGLNTNTFSSIKLDNFINDKLSRFLTSYLFSDDKTAKTLSDKAEDNMIIKLSTNGHLSYSLKLNLPTTKNEILELKNFISHISGQIPLDFQCYKISSNSFITSPNDEAKTIYRQYTGILIN